jgi:hypothetical protein
MGQYGSEPFNDTEISQTAVKRTGDNDQVASGHILNEASG